MKKGFAISLLVLTVLVEVYGQLTPQQAIKKMGRGINLGNSFDAPDGETTWGNPTVTESHFEDYKSADFSCVRIPITWDKRTATTSPYTINAAFLNRIEQVVDWGLKHKLMVIINAHHDSWIKNTYSETNKARFDSIWSQVASRFKNKSDSLLFEIINEPEPLSLANVNDLNARTLKTIRKTNPTRIVLFSGHRWSNSEELLAAAIPNDNYLIGYYHSYDPYPFGLIGTGSYGSDADINTTNNKFTAVSNWSTQHNIPVVISEFGAINKCEYNSRMCLYATDVEKALIHNVAFNVWDDGGDFKIYDRAGRKWNEIKDILIHTYKESPNKLKVTGLPQGRVKIQWQNRTTQNDSIIIERKTGDGSFALLRKISPTAAEFVDSTTTTGSTYYYRLKANIKDSIEIQSYPVRVIPTLTTVANETADDFLIYPNPAKNTISVKGVEYPGEIEIYNATGTLVQKILVNNEGGLISVNELTKGLYMVKYKYAKKVYSGKLLKE